jgi:transposase
MNSYLRQHDYYCGIDLHARRMYTCILKHDGEVVFHRNLKTRAEEFFEAIAPWRDEDLVVGVESTYNWYWLSDLCDEHHVPFVLGHAYAMKAIHGAKNKNDKKDSMKIAMLLRGGNFPIAYAYPKATRAQRDLTRRRGYFVRKRAELQAHVRNTASQYNITLPAGSLRYQSNQEGMADRFAHQASQQTIQADLNMINALSEQIQAVEDQLRKLARIDDAGAFYRLKSVPGIGDILAMVILYEVGDIKRFKSAGDFLSYCRLVPGSHESDGKKYGSPGRKQGNPHLKWAFSEAVALSIRDGDFVKDYFRQWEQRHGRGKALSILAARLARAVYLMLKRGDAFDELKFFHMSKEEATARQAGKPARKRRRKSKRAPQTTKPEEAKKQQKEKTMTC